MKKALITGITGQDGAYLAEFLLEKGYEVHGIKRRASQFNTQRIDHLYQDPHVDHRRLILHYGDVTDSSNLTRILSEVKPGEVLLADGYTVWAPDTSRQMPIAEAFNLAEAEFGTLGSTGWYNTPKDVHGEYRGGTIGASPAYSFTAHVAEVDVDVESGMVEVKKIWVAHDCGRATSWTWW